MTEQKLDHAAEFAKGVREFNSWRFYDCHETLEDVWLECGGKAISGDERGARLALAPPPGKPEGMQLPEGAEGGGKAISGEGRDDLADFYQGVIKAAAGMHHVLRGNHGGAIKVLGDVPRLLDAYRPRTLGLDVDRLLADIERVLAEVRRLGPERIAEFDKELVPQLVVEAGEAS